METQEVTQHGGYANLTNDYMFKRIFGSEECKDILISFLNRIVGNGKIADVTFQNTEHLGPTAYERKAVFDIAVRTLSGEEYIIEMQLAQQAHFRDRALFYTSYPVINQAVLAKERHIEKNGDPSCFRWNFNLKPIRFIAVVNFRMEHGAGWDAERYHSSYRLREDDTGELLHDKLQFIFLELERFTKKECELESGSDKWMYLLKNMSRLKSRPVVFDGKEFDRLFEMAELCNFTAEQYINYQESQKMIYDYENTIDFARQQGHEQGLAEGREDKALEVAKKMLEAGMPSAQIASITGLDEEQVRQLS